MCVDTAVLVLMRRTWASAAAQSLAKANGLRLLTGV